MAQARAHRHPSVFRHAMAQVRECADGLTPRPRGPRPRAGGLEGEVCTYWGVYRRARLVVGKYFVAILGAERMINSITLGESSCTVRRHGQLVQAAKGFCVNVRWRRGALHGFIPQCRAPNSPWSPRCPRALGMDAHCPSSGGPWVRFGCGANFDFYNFFV